jgi:hypothetical protein
MLAYSGRVSVIAVSLPRRGASFAVIRVRARRTSTVAVVIGIHRRHLVGLVLGEELDALVGLEVVLHPELLAFFR